MEVECLEYKSKLYPVSYVNLHRVKQAISE